MSQITAEIDLTALSITGVQTVTLATTDIYGVSYTIATLSQDFTGVSTSEFINLVRAEVNSGASGFLAFNENPILKLTRSPDVDTFVGEQVSLTFGASNFNASWLKVQSTVEGCSPCYNYDLYACYGNYVVDLSLDPTTAYNVIIADKFQKNYVDQVTTDADGKFTITVANYPDGFFTPENGPLTVTLSTAANVAATFTIGYVTYDCLTFNIENYEGV